MSVIRNYAADAAIGKYLIVKSGAASGSVAVGSADNEDLIGVTTDVGAAKAGDRVDVVHAGLASVVFGANVTKGRMLTADAAGRAVPASKGRVIGMALETGVADQTGLIIVTISKY